MADVGITGVDKGEGGKYLLLPPGFKGDIPSGYHVVRPSTFGSWLVFRAFVVDGSTRPGVDSVKKNLRVYRLADAANPPPMKFVNASGIPANFVAPGDYSFWSLLNQVIQEEPAAGSDPTTLGLFASLGIVKGQPFNPDERMQKILTDAANIGAVTARAIAFKIRSKEAYFYHDGRFGARFPRLCAMADNVYYVKSRQRRASVSAEVASRRKPLPPVPGLTFAVRIEAPVTGTAGPQAAAGAVYC